MIEDLMHICYVDFQTAFDSVLHKRTTANNGELGILQNDVKVGTLSALTSWFETLAG